MKPKKPHSRSSASQPQQIPYMIDQRIKDKTLESWEKRWRTVEKMILDMTALLETRMSNEDDQACERCQTLHALLKALHAFGEGQFHFFRNGFDTASSIRLEHSDSYPVDYVFATTFNQISFDLDVILRAYQQRLAGVLPISMRDTLALADQLAYDALKPASLVGLIEPGTVVTYLQKSPMIRITPYAPAAIIGIPLSVVQRSDTNEINDVRDLLAIPHEVGHYVFQHGMMHNNNFASGIKHIQARQPVWLRQWIEEIFADVYGCLIAGPVIARDFQELQLRTTAEQFTSDDSDHPSPIVRPSIYLHTLRKMAEMSSKTSPVDYIAPLAELERDWKNSIEQRGEADSITLQNPTNGEPVTLALAEVQKALGKVIEQMLEIDPISEMATHCIEHQIWSQTDNFDDFSKEIYGKWQAGSLTNPPELGVEGDQLFLLTHQGARPTSGRTLGKTGLWLDALKGGATQFKMPSVAWVAILDFSGWAAEGPGPVNYGG